MNFVGLFFGADWVIKATILGLIGMSMISWSIAIDKLRYLKKIEKHTHQTIKIFERTQSLDGLDSTPSSPLTHILSLVKRSKKFDSKTESRMIQLLNKETEELYKKLGIIGAISSTAPFVGLFGTVWGIMNSLQVLGNNNQLHIVAPMIGEALFVTAIGFVVAIPASLLFNAINQRIERINTQWLGFIIHISHTLDTN